MGYLWTCSVLGHFGFIQYSCLKLAWKSKCLPLEQNRVKIGVSSVEVIQYTSQMDCNLKRLHVGQNWLKFGTRIMVGQILGAFDGLPSVFKIILGSFSTLISKWCATQKRLSVQQRELQFGTRILQGIYYLYGVPLNWWCSRSFWGSFGAMSQNGV